MYPALLCSLRCFLRKPGGQAASSSHAQQQGFQSRAVTSLAMPPAAAVPARLYFILLSAALLAHKGACTVRRVSGSPAKQVTLPSAFSSLRPEHEGGEGLLFAFLPVLSQPFIPSLLKSLSQQNSWLCGWRGKERGESWLWLFHSFPHWSFEILTFWDANALSDSS